MGKRSATVLAIVAALLALAAPIVFSIHSAQRRAAEQQERRALDYALAVTHRSDLMLDQVGRAVTRIRAAGAVGACDPARIDAMRRADLSSSYIQALGHVVNNRMVCSSIDAQAGTGFDLGPYDAITPRGMRIRYSVRFPFGPDSEFLVLETVGYAAVLHKELPLDLEIRERDVALGVFATNARRFAVSRGAVRREWIDRIGGAHQVVFRDRGYVIAVVRSNSYLLAGLAALPEKAVQQEARRVAMQLVPIGAVAGLAFALAILTLARAQLGMPSIIRIALRRHEFFLQYQPIVALDSGACIGAEALIRWRRPCGEMVRPDLFIKVAEDTGLIQKITERVLGLIEKDAPADLFDRHPHFHLAINLSAADLSSSETLGRLRRLAAAIGARPGNLVVEATERGFLDAAVARELVQRLRDNGFRVAIDDFGTGYSSLSYLETFGLDYLKIDKSFVDTIGANAATSQVVPHIIEMGKSLGFAMIAEGVEEESQAQYLRERGVQYAQGWLFGRPMSLAQVLAMLPE
jgi:sensor c-di-GMP phosphodiesterase-like protein